MKSAPQHAMSAGVRRGTSDWPNGETPFHPCDSAMAKAEGRVSPLDEIELSYSEKIDAEWRLPKHKRAIPLSEMTTNQTLK